MTPSPHFTGRGTKALSDSLLTAAASQAGPHAPQREGPAASPLEPVPIQGVLARYKWQWGSVQTDWFEPVHRVGSEEGHAGIQASQPGRQREKLSP